MQKKQTTRLGIIVDKKEWEIFKKIAKAKESDSSKEIRKFIKRYIEENQELINKLF